MGKLTVKNLFGEKDLILEGGESAFKVANDTLIITIHFPGFYNFEDFDIDDPESLPVDYWFKESGSKLELEFPLSNPTNEVIGNEIFIDSEDEKNEDLTNFFIANTYYPTFDDRILITEEGAAHRLKWTGFLPDIKNSRYEIYMKNKFSFTLEADCHRIE